MIPTNLLPREDTGKQILDMLHKSFEATRYDAKSVLAGLILSLGGAFLLFICFCFIRPRHNLIYAPRMRYCEDEKKPKPLGSRPFSWIKPVFVTTEETLIEKLGIDAAVFIRFIIMIRNMFMVISVLGCAIAIPINVYYNLHSKNSGSISAADSFRLMTPSSLTGYPLVAHIVLAWVIDAVVLTFLYLNLRKVVDIRRKTFMTSGYQNALFMRTLLVSEIPRKYLSERGVATLMDRYKVSRPINQINIGRNVKELSRLLAIHETTVIKLEKVLAKYLKNPNQLPAKRPTCRPMKEDKGMYPKKVDAVEYYIQRIQRLEKQIGSARDAIDNKSYLPFGQVSYHTQEDCHTVAKGIGHGRQDKLLVSLAPRAQDIIWKNIVLSRFERRNKQWWGNFLFAILLLAWIVPNAFIGCFLTQLSRIGTLSQGFQNFMNGHTVLFSILQGFLAPAITSIIFLILPIIMRRMSQWEGKIAKSERERDVTLKLYVFFFFNNFLVLTVTNVIWNITTMIIDLRSENKSIDVMEAIEKFSENFSSSIITASSFWVMYLLRANVGLMLDLLQVFTLFYNSFQRYVLSPTPRELMLATAPQPFQYASYYNWLLFYSTIALAFTSIQPLVLPILTFYLCLDTVVKKYMLMYMFVTKVESDGMYWPLINNCLTFATLFGNLVVLAVVWVQGGWRLALGVVPLPIIVIAFKIFTAYKYNDKFRYFIPTPAEREFMDLQATMHDTFEFRSNLEQRYVNPAISKRLPVPMVHARAEHLLKTVCTVDSMGSLDGFEYEANPMLPGNRDLRCNKEYNRRSYIGENKFDLIGENELDYDHYRRMQEESSIAPGSRELDTIHEPGAVGMSHDDPDAATLQPPPTIYKSRSSSFNSSSESVDLNPYGATSTEYSHGVMQSESRSNLIYNENDYLTRSRDHF